MLADGLTPVTWSSLWSIQGLVALGTLVLASATAALAGWTSRLASKTARAVRLTEIEIGAGLRPVLIAVPTHEFVADVNYYVRIPGINEVRGAVDRGHVFFDRVEDVTFVSVPFRNEGTGMAFATAASLRAGVQEWPGEVSLRQVPVHELTRASFSIPSEPSGEFVVEIKYSDLAYNSWGSRLTIALERGAWSVTHAEVTSGEIKAIAV